MIVNCNICQKKFNLPTSAITESGRLLKCGSCGNEWTQYPIKEKSEKEIKKTFSTNIKQPAKVNKIKTSVKNKKREINLYSEEYLKKKHGLVIKDTTRNKEVKKKSTRNGFGFLSYLIIISILSIGFFGILNLSKDVIISSYPLTEPYINYSYEILNIIRETVSNFLI